MRYNLRTSLESHGMRMANIVTAEEFLSLILATLKLRVPDQDLRDSELDRLFEQAYEALSENEARLGVRPNFTFYRHSLHGNSVSLRDALVSAFEKGFLESKPGRNATYQVSLSPQRARALLERSSLHQDFLDSVTEKVFAAPTGH
jgi:hypothetical protein